MAEPDWNPDTGGRPLAEILREAGIDTSKAARRRRWDEPDEEPVVRQRRPDAEAAGRPFGRRRTDAEELEAGAARSGSSRAGTRQPSPSRAVPAAASSGSPSLRDRRPMADPSTAAIPGLRPDRAPAVPHPSAPLPDISAGALRGDRITGRVADRAVGRDTGRVADRAVGRDTGRVADRGLDRDTGRTGVRAARQGQRPAPRDELTSTGPIPVVRATDVDDLDEDATPQESALAWLRFIGELVIALAVGVGVFFAATLLWEMAAYVALLLVPLAVSGLVAGVGMWRQRQGAEPVGPRLLALLVFAGTLLTIVPAAQLLATG